MRIHRRAVTVPLGDLGPGLSSVSPPPGDVGKWNVANIYPKAVREKFLNDRPFNPDDLDNFKPPKPEQAADAVRSPEHFPARPWKAPRRRHPYKAEQGPRRCVYAGGVRALARRQRVPNTSGYVRRDCRRSARHASLRLGPPTTSRACGGAPHQPDVVVAAHSVGVRRCVCFRSKGWRPARSLVASRGCGARARLRTAALDAGGCHAPHGSVLGSV